MLGNEYAKSFQKLSSGLDVIESLEGRNTVYSAQTCILMAKLKFGMQDYHKAIHLYERGLEIYTQLFGISHSYSLRIFINIVHLCFLNSNMNKLGQIMEKAMKALDETVNIPSCIKLYRLMKTQLECLTNLVTFTEKINVMKNLL